VKDILDQSGYEGEKLTFKTVQEQNIIVSAAEKGFQIRGSNKMHFSSV